MTSRWWRHHRSIRSPITKASSTHRDRTIVSSTAPSRLIDWLVFFYFLINQFGRLISSLVRWFIGPVSGHLLSIDYPLIIHWLSINSKVDCWMMASFKFGHFFLNLEGLFGIGENIFRIVRDFSWIFGNLLKYFGGSFRGFGAIF